MLKAFSFDELLTGFGVLTPVIFGLIILTKKLCRQLSGRRSGAEREGKDGTERSGFFGRATTAVDLVTQAVTIAGLVLWVMDATALWRPVWSALGLNQRVFPDLNGTWTGTILSNGRIHKHPDLCTKPLPSPDPTACNSQDPAKFVCLPVEVKISMTLVSTDVELTLCDNLKSESSGVSLTRRSGFHVPRLTYLFDSDNPGPSSPPQFHGATYIDIDIEKAIPLVGYYWTDRDWEIGHQTAGQIRLTRQ
jgi:hypothetical protein